MAAAMVEVAGVVGEKLVAVVGGVNVWVRLDGWRGQWGTLWVVLEVRETRLGEEGEEGTVHELRRKLDLPDNQGYGPHISVAKRPLSQEELLLARY